MTEPTETLTAREYVWTHRIRQRIAFERIILTVGNPKEKYRAKQFLEAMEEAYPELLEDFEQYPLELLYQYTPEMFDESEYSRPRGRKTALKLPKDVAWEEKTIRRAAREYMDLFHPCENVFNNAMKGLQYINNLHPELFAKARSQAIEHREQILSCEIYCKCDCTTAEDRQPADSFRISNHGRLENVSKRINLARKALESTGDDRQGDWQFFLDRIKELAPEMLSG